MNNARIAGKNLIVKSSLILDPTQLTHVEQALFLAQDYLQNFASEQDFGQKMAIAFGEGVNVDSLATAWITGDFSDFPEIEVRHAADINGANGAFAAATNRIYLSQEFITNHQGDVGAIARVLLEEFGHWVDTQINTADAPGDEGAIFAAFVRGDMLNESQLQKLETEDDTGIINIDGISLKAEFSYPDLDSGGNNTSTAYDLGTLGSAKKTTEINDYLGSDFVDYRDEADFFKFTLDTASKVNIVFVSGSFVDGPPEYIPTASVSSLGTSDLKFEYTGGGGTGFSNETIDFFGVMEPGTYYFWIGLPHPVYSLYNYNAKLQVDPITNLDLSISSDQGVIGISPELTYTVNLTNNSSQSATDATTEIILPKGMEFVKADLQPTSNITDEITGETKLNFTIPNSIAPGKTFTNRITTTVTGFSQPLDKVLDFRWNLDVKGSATANILDSGNSVARNTSFTSNQVDSRLSLATANISGTNVESDTASISTQVNSSLGLAADSARRFSLTSKQNIENLAQNVQKAAFQNYVETPLKTWQENLRQRTEDLFGFGVNKVFSAIQSDTNKIVYFLNQSPPQVRQKVVDEGLAIGKEKIRSLGEAAVKAYLPGAYQAFKSYGLSVDNDFLKYQQPIANGSISLDVYLGKLEDITISGLQSVLKHNPAPAQSRIESTINNFTAKASYSKALPGYQVNVGIDYTNTTQTLSYDLGGSFSLGKGFQLGGSVKGQIGVGQSLPSGWLNLTWDGQQRQNNSPQNQRNLSPLGFTEEPSDNLQLLSTLEAFALTDSAVKASVNQSDSLLAITQGNGDSTTPLPNSDGLFLAFTSAAYDLVAGDTNGVSDVFIRNSQTNTLERISLSDDETQANGKSEVFAISDDGRYVVFASDASNLVDNDTNDVRDIFIRDTQTASTRRISIANDGNQADGVSNLAAISGDGRYVVFSSIASNLVQGDTNGAVDVFLRDLQAETTELISVANEGIQSNSDSLSPDAAISADGRYVVFYSYASNLVANDTNEVGDIFLRDRQTGTTKRISIGINGTEANEISLSPSISADGHYVVFSSLASNLVSGDTNETGDIFVYDLQAETLERVSLTSDETELDSNSSRPSISANGRYVVFQSLASYLGVDNPDSYNNIYLRDRLTGETKLVSPSLNSETRADSINPSISGDGSYIGFQSTANNLVAGATNASSNIYVYKPVISENSEPVTEANKTLTVLEDAAPIALAIAIPTDADNDPLTITVTTVPETTKGEIRLPNNTVVTANTSLTTEQLTSLVFAPVTNANGSAGTFSYTVSDGNGGTATQTLTLEITAVNDAPTLNSAIANQTATEDTAFSLTFDANTFSDIDAGDSLTYSATLKDGSNLPSWLKFNSATRTFSGTPTNADINIIDIKVAATDTSGATVSDDFSLSVDNVNDAPILNSAIADQSTPTDTAFSFTFDANTFSDIDAGDSLTYSATLKDGSNLPSWLKFNSATRTFSGTPTNADISIIDIKVAATDTSGATVSDDFSLSVDNVNDAPILNSAIADATATEYTTFTFTIPANTFSDVDVDAGDILTYSATLDNDNALPSWLTFDAETRTFSGTPANADVGTLNIKVSAIDNFGASVSDIFSLAVINTNHAPILENAIANQTATEDTAFSFTFDANTFSDIDAGDSLTYSATLKDGSNLPSWLKFNSATRTFSGTPTNADISIIDIKVAATDTSGATVSDDFSLTVDNVNDAPTLENAIADQSTSADTAFSFTFDANTFSDIDAGDSLTYSATLKDGSNLPSWLKFNPATRTFSGTATNANVGSFTIEVQATDNDGVSATDTFVLAVEQSNSSPTLKLSKIADDIFNIFNSSGKSKLQVTLTGRSSNLVNELGAFTVDDAQGNINGIAPGAAGYAQAALDRAKVIFSAIANLPNGFNTNNLTHLLEFNSGENLRFYLIRNSTTDAVRAGVTPLTDILFSDPLKQKITDLGSDQFSLAWKDKDGNSTTDFKDLVVKIQSTNDALPLGTNLQGKPQGEVIDLRDVTNQVKADFVVNREAAFDNFIGFYQVADENGGIDTNSDGKADIFAGQAGYIEAAIRNRVAGIDLTVNNQGTATYTGTFQPGSIFAPFIIANGRPDALLDSNPNNDPAVYFPFLGANTDKKDHIRLLGNNSFGFEDLANGGDNDFNDAIVRVNLSIA
ncbi:hypothetical protein NIES2100_19920 [Calothrix sp. NIES-2100]|uniref:putative Ig domain-containing protein n=1 Tax=Calothrix sp. NIES-2100 TaxID=1954172 RepID=UPI000B604B81|nr:hypothetical protein NIES2100_19920 [Calothrix sp. NIES-2100]